MNANEMVSALSALASRPRFALFRLLVREAPEGVVAGEIAAALKMSPSQVTFHAKTLERAGLVVSEQEGRFVRYRAVIPRMHALIAYLTEACCARQPEVCSTLRSESNVAAAWFEPAQGADAPKPVDSPQPADLSQE